ncbi:MAG: hypothetical protein ACP5NS_00455 [Candidatus Pacearchaeota archaeon]
MVLIYRGKLSELENELAGARETLNSRYKEILGESAAVKVSETAQRILPPDCFFDDYEVANKKIGAGLKAESTNCLLLATDAPIQVTKEGKVENHKLRTGLGFYISERGFEESGSAHFTDRPVASYVHEFDHFIWYALQKVPLYFARMALLDQSGATDFNLTPEEFVNTITTESLESRRHKTFLYAAACTLNEIFEKSNRILDRQILSAIGVDVPIPWRGQKRQYQTFIAGTTIVTHPVDGDPFRDIEDREVIRKVIDWPDHFHFASIYPYADAVLQSLSKVKVSRVSLSELIEGKSKKRKK